MRLTTCTVDLRTRTVRHAGSEQHLSALEASLLAYLAENAGRDVSREALLARGWSGRGSARTVDFAIRRLRRKLGDPADLLTSHGVGYRLVPPPPEDPPVHERPKVQVASGAIDLDRRTFTTTDGRVHSLSRVECDLLEELASGAPRVRSELVRTLWGVGDHAGTLATTLSRLRSKLEAPEAAPVLDSRPDELRLVVVGTDRSNLGPPSWFVDRSEVAEVCEAVRGARLVTVTGTAGIGKTRLARRAARALLADGSVDRVRFCDLGSASGAADLVAAVGIGLRAPPGSEALRRAFVDQPSGTLVVLDNFEQLVAERDLVAGWLADAPGVRFVVTSRIALGLPDEVVVEASPLPTEAGAALYRSVAGDHHDPAAVASLVERLDGLPLAIELAAARAGRIGPGELVDRWDERLDLLIRPPVGARSRHSTLRGALDWSWELLAGRERATLASLGVFEGAFPRERALVVAGEDADLEALVAAALVHRTSDRRYRLYDGIRAYAREKRRLAGDESAVVRHAELHLELALSMIAGPGIELNVGMRAIGPELCAIPAAIGGARAGLAVGILFEVQGRTGEADRVYEAALPGAPPELAWQMLAGRARAARLRGDAAQALTLVTRSHAVAETVDPHSGATAGIQVANMLKWLGRYGEAEEVGAACLATWDGLGRTDDAAVARAFLASLALGEDRLADACALARAALAGDGTSRAMAGLTLANALLALGRPDEAEAVALVASGCDTPLQDEYRAHSRVLCARARIVAGRHAGIDDELRALEETYVRMGLHPWQQACRRNRALLAIRCGDLLAVDPLLDGPGEWRHSHDALMIGTLAAALRGQPEDALRRLAAVPAKTPSRTRSFEVRWHTLRAVMLAEIGDREGAQAALAEGRRSVGSLGCEVVAALGSCLVDGDRERLGWARRQRSDEGHRWIELLHAAWVLHALASRR